MRRALILVPILVVAFVAAACGSGGPEQVVGNVEYVSTTSTTTSTTTTSTTTPAPTTTADEVAGAGALKWRTCGDGIECA
ncbi:MAG TPA: hypothetical protein QF865_00085, partial [Acidimicrobiales bacterium]|nr:hypothetical protein [Acidimicrobiales bacterium]